MNWRRILNRVSRAQVDNRHAATSADLAGLDAVDRLYRETPRLEPDARFRAEVRSRIATLHRNPETREVASFMKFFLPRTLLAGAGAVVIGGMTLTLLWSSYSQAHAAPVLVCEIKGMICQGCARNVSEILSRVPGVRRAEVDVKTGRARVILQRHKPVSLTQLSAALEQTKYFHISDVSVAAEPEPR